MREASSPFFQKRTACFLIGLALSACAAPHTVADDRFDGAYAGTRTQDPACGNETRSVIFHVEAGRIEVRSRHKHRALAGTVSVNGEVALSDAYGSRQVTGRIVGNRLEATEAAGLPTDSKHRQITQDDPAALSCAWRYVALRTADQGSVPVD